MSREGVRACVALLLAVTLDAAAASFDGPFPVGNGVTPYHGACGLATTGDMNLPSVETDARITVSDGKVLRLQLAFMQDPVLGIRTAFSDDLGKTWQLRDPPLASVCSARRGTTFGDQDIAADKDGSLGLIYISGSLIHDARDTSGERYAFDSRVLFSRSADRGGTWGAPVVVSEGGAYQHTAMIVADSQATGRFYAAWATIPNPPGLLPRQAHLAEGFVYFASSTDSGLTWSKPAAISAGLQLWDLKLTANGSLLAFVDANHIVSSRDHGATWSKPLELPAAVVNSAIYEFAGHKVMAGDRPLAIGARDELYLVTSRNDATGGSVRFLKSADNGHSWNASQEIDGNTGGVFHSTVAADLHGHLAVMWYEVLKSAPGGGDLPVRVRIASSIDGGLHWSARQVSPVFDMSKAPVLFGARYLGNYQALTSVGAGQFVGVYAVSAPLAHHGAADLRSFRLSIAEQAAAQ